MARLYQVLAMLKSFIFDVGVQFGARISPSSSPTMYPAGRSGTTFEHQLAQLGALAPISSTTLTYDILDGSLGERKMAFARMNKLEPSIANVSKT